jgi:twitching motility protein PilT
MPESARHQLASGSRAEWTSELPNGGRVVAVGVPDRQGITAIFQLTAGRAVSAEQLGLSPEVQALALEAEGLVLVGGPLASGKSTIIAALVDLINRMRHGFVITFENDAQVLHDAQASIISQREIADDLREQEAAIRQALREGPDVLVIEELMADGVVRLALEAATSGRLVIAGLRAHTASDAVDRVIEAHAPERRQYAQWMLADSLRGVVVQLLLRGLGGGRMAAREVLFNTPSVAGLIADRQTSQLPLEIERGRHIGMIPLNESLAGLVTSGLVELDQAYRRAGDRRGLIALLKSQGVDTSTLEV